MSMELMVLAMKAQVGHPLRKLVLLKLADNASDQGECWPSYQHIADQCEISKSTVREHIKELEKSGFLTIENRVGEGGCRSNLYRLTLCRHPAHPMPPPGTPYAATRHTPMPPRGTPYAATRHTPMPPRGTRTSHIEPVIEPVNKTKPSAKSLDVNLPDWLDRQTFDDFVAMRKKIKRPMTDRAASLLVRKLERLREKGHDPVALLERSILNSWQDVYEPSSQSASNRAPRTSRMNAIGVDDQIPEGFGDGV